MYKICVDIFLWCVFQEGLLDDDFPQKEEGFISPGENEDEEHNGMEYSKQVPIFLYIFLVFFYYEKLLIKTKADFIV